MVSRDTLLLMPCVLTACLLWSQLDGQRNSNFLLLRNYLSLMYSFGPRPITSPVHGIISWCRCVGSSRSPTVLTSFWRFRLLARLCPLLSPFGMCTQNLELRGMGPATKFCNWIRRPAENTGILSVHTNHLY